MLVSQCQGLDVRSVTPRRREDNCVQRKGQPLQDVTLSRRHFATISILGITQLTTKPARATSKVVKKPHPTDESPLYHMPASSQLNAGLLPDSSFHAFSQFDTVDDIPSQYFDNERVIYGFCERVIDGDTIRVRHVRGFGSGLVSVPRPLEQRGIAKVTLSIRIYGVDAPETGKNKRQTSMPFGEEAAQLMTDLVYHRMVKIRLLRKDQYHRAVCVVETVPTGFFGRLRGSQDVSMVLAEAGLAELYTGGGAVYYDKRAALEAAIAKAQRKKLGIWSLPNRQSAAEFKREQKQQVSENPPNNKNKRSDAPILAVTGVQNTVAKQRGGATATTATKHAPRVYTSSNNNKENLMDAVVTGLEFLG